MIQAHDGHQGKAAIYNQRPDLVILDMMMPRMGGYPVLEHFRDKTDAPPVIMITANEGSRHKAYAEYLGVVAYIRKPFATEKLLEAVNKAFEAPAPQGDTGEDGASKLAFGRSRDRQGAARHVSRSWRSRLRIPTASAFQVFPPHQFLVPSPRGSARRPPAAPGTRRPLAGTAAASAGPRRTAPPGTPDTPGSTSSARG